MLVGTGSCTLSVLAEALSEESKHVLRAAECGGENTRDRDVS